MSDRDTITLPREVVKFVLQHLEWWSNDEPQEKEAIAALRTALAAEQPKHDLMKWAKDAGSSPEDLERFATYTIATRDMEIATLREENEALRRDAERYRYLRNRDPAEVLSKEGKDAGCWIDCEEKGGIAYKLQLLTGDDADAAIDAAMGDKT